MTIIILNKGYALSIYHLINSFDNIINNKKIINKKQKEYLKKQLYLIKYD